MCTFVIVDKEILRTRGAKLSEKEGGERQKSRPVYKFFQCQVMWWNNLKQLAALRAGLVRLPRNPKGEDMAIKHRTPPYTPFSNHFQNIFF